jgi:hypothetical protein
MSTIHKAMRALQAGFGLALVTALALVGGCASESEEAAGESQQIDEAPVGEATAAIGFGYFACFYGGVLSTLEINQGPTGSPTCRILGALNGASQDYCTSSPYGITCRDCRALGNSAYCAWI